MYYNEDSPFGRDSYRDLMCKDARRSFSRFHLGIFAYVASAYVIGILAELILVLLFRDSYESIVTSLPYRWIMGVAPMYLVGLPILYLIVKSMPKGRLEKSKLSLGEFLIFFAIAQALMLVGNSIGTTLNDFFGALRGDEISNSTSELIESSPLWVTLIVAVIIGPIVEEFIFRKLMIDRLSRFGAWPAILISGFSFGLFHGNFYQFFYAAMLGVLLAFITVKTGNWIYSVIMHITINFFGSVAVMPIIDVINEFTAALENAAAGESIDMQSFVIGALTVMSYSIVQYAVSIAGIVLLILAVKNKWFKIKSTAEANLPRENVFSVVFFNVGMIIFFVTSMILFAVSILLG